MRAPGFSGEVAALNLVFALGAGLYSSQAMRNSIVDGLIVAGLKVQEAVVLYTAPVPSVECVSAKQVQCPSDRLPISFDDEKHDLLCHAPTQLVEELEVQRSEERRVGKECRARLSR